MNIATSHEKFTQSLCPRLRKDITSTRRSENFTIAADLLEAHSAIKRLRAVARELPDREAALRKTPVVPWRFQSLHILAGQNL